MKHYSLSHNTPSYLQKISKPKKKEKIIYNLTYYIVFIRFAYAPPCVKTAGADTLLRTSERANRPCGARLVTRFTRKRGTEKSVEVL